MGLTDNENPLGLMPFLMPGIPGFGRRRRRRRRSSSRRSRRRHLPEPDLDPASIHGGERVVLYQAAEDVLFRLGMDGKACLLRAICEMHEGPLTGYGLFGEVLHIFLT